MSSDNAPPGAPPEPVVPEGTDASIPEVQPQKPLTTKNGQPLTVWDMPVGDSGQTVRQSVVSAILTWVGAGVASYFYWRIRAIQKHGEFTQNDLNKWPFLVAVLLISGLIVVYLYRKNVFPAARRELAARQEKAKQGSRRSSTTPPEN
jgi:hypothetical protein